MIAVVEIAHEPAVESLLRESSLNFLDVHRSILSVFESTQQGRKKPWIERYHTVFGDVKQPGPAHGPAAGAPFIATRAPLIDFCVSARYN
jgi:hypothetical protein